MGDIPLGVMTYRWYTMDIERQPFGALGRWYGSLERRAGFREHVAIGLS